MEAVQWEDNEQLSLARRALKPGDRVWVTREALEKFGWKDERRSGARGGGEPLADKVKGVVVKQLIVINDRVVEEGGVVDFLTEARDHDGKEGCTCKMASKDGALVEWKEQIDPNCPLVEERRVRLLVQARV